MAYVSSWRRDGASTGLGGARRGVADTLEVCVIPGCGRSAGPIGRACAGCRVAYAGAIVADAAVETAAKRTECWLCGGAARGPSSTCQDCGPVAERRRASVVASPFGSAGEFAEMRTYGATPA